MNAAEFKKRTINILEWLGDPAIAPTIKAIQSIHPRDESGFSDIEAKVYILYYALMYLIKNDYFKTTKNLKDRLLAQLIYHDENDFTPEYIISPYAILETLELYFDKNPEQVIKDKLNVLHKFIINSQDLRKHYSEQSQKSVFSLNEIPNDSFSLIKLQHDVEQETSMTKKLSSKYSLGTTGLGPCIAICIVSKGEKTNYATVGHLSTVTDNDIYKMLDSFHKKKSDSASDAEIYLIGGCISNIENALNILMNMKIGITDFRLCTNDNAMNDTAVVIRGDSTQIAYTVFMSRPILAAIPASNASTVGFFKHQDNSNEKMEDIKEQEKPFTPYQLASRNLVDPTFLEYYYAKEEEEKRYMDYRFSN